MRNLSVMEQKQVVGGFYVKVYYASGPNKGKLAWKSDYFSDYDDADAYAAQWNKAGYSAWVI